MQQKFIKWKALCRQLDTQKSKQCVFSIISIPLHSRLVCFILEIVSLLAIVLYHLYVSVFDHKNCFSGFFPERNWGVPPPLLFAVDIQKRKSPFSFDTYDRFFIWYTSVSFDLDGERGDRRDRLVCWYLLEVFTNLANMNWVTLALTLYYWRQPHEWILTRRDSTNATCVSIDYIVRIHSLCLLLGPL